MTKHDNGEYEEIAQTSNAQKTFHSSSVKVSYGVSIVNILEEELIIL